MEELCIIVLNNCDREKMEGKLGRLHWKQYFDISKKKNWKC